MCEHGWTESLDTLTENNKCNCGIIVCLDCGAEFDKSGEQVALGVWTWVTSMERTTRTAGAIATSTPKRSVLFLIAPIMQRLNTTARWHMFKRRVWKAPRIKNPAKCIDCNDVYELDGLNLDLRCSDCVDQWLIDDMEMEESEWT